MENFELTAYLKALLLMQVAVQLHAISKGMLPSFQIFCNEILHEALNLTKLKPMAQSESQ